MAAGKWDLLIEQGVPYSTRFRIGMNGSPMALADRQVHAQARSRSGRDLLLDITPYLTVEPADMPGVIDMLIPATVTRALTRDGVWDLFIDDPGADDVRGLRLLAGVVVVARAVTHA